MHMKYDDIIDLPRHKSSTRPPMPREKRAAQFAPFAALTGHEEAIKETARLTDRKVELDESMKAILDEKLKIIKRDLVNKPYVEITFFKPDKRKDGGYYHSIKGRVKKIDQHNRSILMEDKKSIEIDEIIEIKLI